ncbi:hypothetical protein [Melaminivora sp.]|uniref:tetratricopeptide repeat protein n=1 Tax=Melaminivora sp. TaxID=1933032 RepID=UPI0028A80545|nr:hypothetical protein [Melaminivora sp.]
MKLPSSSCPMRAAPYLLAALALFWVLLSAHALTARPQTADWSEQWAAAPAPPAAPPMVAPGAAQSEQFLTGTPPATPIELSAPVGGSRIEPAGTAQPAPLRLAPEADAPALARLQRLRAAALASAPGGSNAEKAAARSAWILGLLYLHGEGVPLDRTQALHWFERAHAHGEPMASAGLAWCQIDGCQGPANPAAARPWVTQLAGTDASLSLLLQWWVQERLAPMPAPAPGAPGAPAAPARDAAGSARLALLQRAAQAGNAGARNELGLARLAAGRLHEALGEFSLAAEGSPAAAANARLLAERMRQQQRAASPPKPDSADEWLTQALRYHRGEGVPSNYTEAIRLYQIAAAQGSQAARRMLELIYSRPGPDGMVDVAWMRQLATMQVSPEGAVLAMQPPPTPQLFVRDPTPLYALLPPEWRSRPAVGAP